MTLHPPGGRRSYISWEARFLGEWLTTHRPEARVLTHVRVGPISPSLSTLPLSAAEMRAIGLWRRWVDALVILPDRMELVEAKMLQSAAQISQLELYAHLLPQTPELEEFRGRPVDKIALVAVEDPAATYIARRVGIRVIVSPPDWLEEWIEAGMPRTRRPPQSPTIEEVPG